MSDTYWPTVAVDLDGVILEHDVFKGPDHFGEPLPGVKKFLHDLRDMGLRILVYTSRTCGDFERPYSAARRIGKVLDNLGLYYDEIWTCQGKPIAIAYIDDRAIFMNSQTCQSTLTGWASALAEISVAKTVADERHEANPGEVAE